MEEIIKLDNVYTASIRNEKRINWNMLIRFLIEFNKNDYFLRTRLMVSFVTPR